MVAPDSTANMPPNIGLEPTPSSLRSSVDPASRRGSGLAFGGFYGLLKRLSFWYAMGLNKHT
jgi:hypothetical protein